MSANATTMLQGVGCDDSSETIERTVVAECPVATKVNGIACAVMMATPADLENYADGSVLFERIIATTGEKLVVAPATVDQGVILRPLSRERAAPLLERVRMRLSKGSCGLCGLESISEVLRPLLSEAPASAPEAIERPLAPLGDYQAVGARSGAMHAAGFCAADGMSVFPREEVVRRNPVDKLIGALALQMLEAAAGFFLVTGRCSYELVETAVRAGCQTLVAISAPTSLAVNRARKAGLALIGLARRGTTLVARAQEEITC